MYSYFKYDNITVKLVELNIYKLMAEMILTILILINKCYNNLVTLEYFYLNCALCVLWFVHLFMVMLFAMCTATHNPLTLRSFSNKQYNCR